MRVWTMNLDVSVEVVAEDEDQAKEIAERVIEETAGADDRLVAAQPVAVIWGPEASDEEEAQP